MENPHKIRHIRFQHNFGVNLSIEIESGILTGPHELPGTPTVRRMDIRSLLETVSLDGKFVHYA